MSKPARATLIDPGHCKICGQPRVAAVVVMDTGEYHGAVYCLDHQQPRPDAVVFDAHLDSDGRITLWAARGRPLDVKMIRSVDQALSQLGRVPRARRELMQARAAGPWRVYVEVAHVMAPRPPGEIRGEPWRLVAAKLGTSKWDRKCVQCSTVIPNRSEVYRAAKRERLDTTNMTRIEKSRAMSKFYMAQSADGWSSGDLTGCIVCMACVAQARANHLEVDAEVEAIFADLLGVR